MDAAAAPEAEPPDSFTLVINKNRPLAADYVPADLTDAGGLLLRAEAAEAYARMVGDAAAEGVAVSPVSGYRSREEQSRLHASYTEKYGQEGADSLSARPGHSEHETGLAVDIGNPDGLCALETCFEGTAAGSWTAANAHRYGFLIRYPAGAEHITGYAYEPWHLRYVGPEVAGGVHDSGVTLEEFLGFPAAPNY
ncbi:MULTISPECIES: D-alanyl-D-alanine carboxypeptidase family protein [Arthrobacter]|uniref:M15 family metallopeptidase n=1 Tax=Arthrobacter jinronghuae TaxID=2964609 RepID=A0ABT1NTM5_9MICC|nr:MULTISPECIES: M15 family metallopeptidase [Arthrobacter]MCQ1950427.1 M15 family metallopeptidase [Arthrobacter jinronghuae]MCQ1953171.1 M15 family metallopeptidase [Arthrobacter sp. zg-Y238]UWX77401.1 M15 family metallopeptidase [Arthrobacter jinronghuae]